jgi:hypothetical protein
MMINPDREAGLALEQGRVVTLVLIYFLLKETND